MSDGFSEPDEREYYIVGPRYVLRSVAGGPRDGTLTLAVHDGRRPAVGFVSAAVADERVVQLRLDARDPVPAPDRIEIFRLFARVCARRFGLPLCVDLKQSQLAEDDISVLVQDGFRLAEATILIRGCEDFHRISRAQSMEGVYEDAFHVPWNFVPQEREVLTPLLAVESERRGNFAVLDVGCGSGKNAVLLEEWGFQVFGIDLSATAIARCQSLVSNPGHFIVASATSMPFSDNFFKAVVDIGCLHCLEPGDRASAAAEISRVLAPGGVCYSRLFRPRSAGWVAAQPFVAQKFGVSDREALSLFNPSFTKEIYRHDAEMIYLKWTKPC